MKSNYKRLGDFITPVKVRNSDLKAKELLGININKYFMPSVANIVGTDLSKYKVVQQNQFACNRMHVGRDYRIPVAVSQSEEPFMVSPAYDVFDIENTTELMPEYLMMWFSRAEFDRNAWFYTDADVRGGLAWQAFEDMQLPIPHIDKQREIVKEYNTIQNRIKLNEELIQKLEETAQAIYREWFVEGIDLENLPEGWQIKTIVDFCDIKGGKRLPKGNKLNNEKNGNPYIKVADMTKGKFIVLNDSFQFVSNEIQKIISRYIVQTGDIIISIVGTIGLVNIVDSTLLNANLTENCYRLTNFKMVHSDYLYYYLVSPFGKREIESRTVGGVQAKLPMYNVQSLPIVLPKKELLLKFEKTVNPINDLQNTLTIENQKLTELKELLLSKLATVEN
jgi:type I restriction enzyme S subunit